ncbi:MAG: helix-turn-helix domain-containing protein [Rikenellaceae bacterium]
MTNPFETIEERLCSLETTISHLCGTLIEKQETTPDEINYLTRKETAARLRVSLVTLTEWVNRSRLKAYKIGGRVLFRESEVEAALSQIVPLKHKRR